MQEPRSILTKAKVCGSVLGGIAILFQGPGVTEPSASSEVEPEPHPNWSEIGRKYKLRWESGFQGGCP